MAAQTAEQQRLVDHRERRANWRKWGPYLSERAWGTVREDYSPGGDAWRFFTHDQAPLKAYRWGEDGLAGICDRDQFLCFALALWNGRDPILKERLFGLTGPEGNHGEDVKEYYFYLDNIPTHSYMKMLYKYPQAAFPYDELRRENAHRGYHDFEYELLDSDIFAEDRYFDVFVEYAKAAEDDVLIQITLVNRGPEAAECYLLPTLWFRNTWSWGYDNGPMLDVPNKPEIRQIDGLDDASVMETNHPTLGRYWLYAEHAPGMLFTENESNTAVLYDVPNQTPYVKDAFHRHLIHDDVEAVNPDHTGTKAAALYRASLTPGQSQVFRLRLVNGPQTEPFANFDAIIAQRIQEADAFYDQVQGLSTSEEKRRIQRQAFAGMLWSKQLYYYDVEQWLNGDPAYPPPPPRRKDGRNNDWTHLANFDVISMPDNWEYPWYATWDLAFHCIPLVMIDPDYAKRQLELITREWYIHPNGQLPAYEWNFGDVNPPVHAWASWRVYKIDAKHCDDQPDIPFLKGIFNKLLLNFTWWVNRKDEDGNNVFQGGFLGLDNISVFDRSSELPAGGRIDQSDATSWMGFFCLEMMRIALELARDEPIYQDMATKFFEHFLRIASAMTGETGSGYSLWDEHDGFFYDALMLPDGRRVPLKVRSLVGLLPLLAVETVEPHMLQSMPVFERRMHWFMDHRPHLTGNMASVDVPGEGARRLMAILTRERLVRLLHYMLDEDEFLSPYGIRSVSKHHELNPYILHLDGQTYTVRYLPAESDSGLFGGNSNWRGPVWFPINYLLIESLQRFHHYYGDDLKVECPTGSGHMMTLAEVAANLSQRLIKLFVPNENGRPVYGGQQTFQEDPHWRDYVLFYEYFHGDNGAGLGASHQTGWTGLVAKLIQQSP
ncbi:MAG: glucosidase [Anaerolineae bacterium]|nr:glucosidase [Anaerolineae bacterium]